MHRQLHKSMFDMVVHIFSRYTQVGATVLAKLVAVGEINKRIEDNKGNDPTKFKSPLITHPTIYCYNRVLKVMVQED